MSVERAPQTRLYLVGMGVSLMIRRYEQAFLGSGLCGIRPGAGRQQNGDKQTR